MNRLQHEHSPYLRQHATNPVDWYPWGEEAFEAARTQDKPIFLSIGYSTCHWCHVMERESFEDEKIAELMNDAFVSIKVDREERPDIDHLYMTVAQIMTGGGGWPLTIIMTPDKRPFFAATYIPKKSVGRVGMLDLIPQVGEVWRTRRADVDSTSSSIVEALQKASFVKPDGPSIDATTLDKLFEELANQFDEEFAGIGTAPKFPSPHNLLFLLRYWLRTGNQRALEMVERTLVSMRNGGIFDHVGFGFHRYATDREWRVPHFEKMLYDQSMITLTYLAAFQATGEPFFATTADEIISYVLRDLRLEGGAFASAEDADSEGEEGKFYTWSYEELREVIGEAALAEIEKDFVLEREGNFHDEATRTPTGVNIIYGEHENAVRMQGDDSSGSFVRLPEAVRRKLFDRREGRVHPFKDDKILTSWNGLMIAALARAGGVLQRPEYVDDARRASQFVLKELKTDAGRLLHRYRDGEAAIGAYATDYAYFVFGLIELYEATFDPAYLREAIELTEIFLEDFWDESSGGFFLTSDEAEELLLRPREVLDSALPSPNSVALLNLLRLGRLTQTLRYEELAVELLDALSGSVANIPTAFGFLLGAADFLVGPSFEVVIVGSPDLDDVKRMTDAIRREYSPNTVVLFKPSDAGEEITALSPFVEYNVSIGGAATAYVCRDYACELPVTTAKEMLALLRESRDRPRSDALGELLD